nr:hypothetical protein CFP56_01052 [Quercus suber]
MIRSTGGCSQLNRSLIPSKKEFWLSDAAVPRSNLDLYLRGEKAEISHPVVAWASQTGKGLLFFNKKGDTNHEHPSSILALYEATDLKKESSHEIVFKLHGHQHTLKAANDVERDGWFISLEKAAELGKAQKESVHESESYKTELESLAKPAVGAAGVAGAAAASRSRSANKKTAEASKEETTAPRAGSDLDDEDVKKTQKSRSTSRGMFNRLKSKKEEVEVKKEEEKAEKDAEKEAEKSGEAAPAVIAGGSALDAPTTAERVLAAPVAAPATEATPETAAETTAITETTPVEEKPKVNKRGSIFGKLGSSWANAKSPVKEKTEKDAELKPEVPAKDAGVSETAPQIPEPNTATEPTSEVVAAVVEPAEPTHESKPAEAAKEQLDAVSPSTQKSGFLSGLFPKRNRSVSPSTPVAEAQKEETPVAATDAPAATPAATEPAAVAEPVALVAAADATSPVEADKAAEESAKTETTTTNKRQSMLGSLGRRASKALNRMQAPKKENVTPTTEAAHEDAVADATPATEAPVVNGDSETKTTEAAAPSTIGDVVPEAVDVGHPQPISTPVVATSA